MSLPSLAEVEHADWPSLKRIAGELGLNPKGRSEVVRSRVFDHMRRKMRPETWTAAAEHRAALLTRLGFPEAAVQLWESTVRLDAPAPWIGLGAAYTAAGRREEAAKAFDRAAQMGDAVAHLHRAELLGVSGDFDGAVHACDDYLAILPWDARGLALKATLLARGGSVDAAIAVLRSALEHHPRTAELRRGLGILLLKAQRYDDAAEAFLEAIRVDPRDLDAQINRGTALLLAGRTRDAIGAFREALEIDPERADALNNLGVAYLRAGREKSGVVNIERAARHLESPQILLNIAHLRESAHRKAEALEAYEEALRLAPRDKEGLAGRKRLGPKPPHRKRTARPSRRAKPRGRKKPTRKRTSPAPKVSRKRR